MPTARDLAVQTLAQQLAKYPDMPMTTPAASAIEAGSAPLDSRETRLAVAIHRTSLQRLITLRYLVERKLDRAPTALEPALQASLIAGAAQLLFMDKMPAHAVVDEMVEIAKKRVRVGAGSMVNAVLRRVAEMVSERLPEDPWSPAPDRIPLSAGATLRLSAPLLPPVNDVLRHLSIATSHPIPFIERLSSEHDDQTLRQLLLHSLKSPPIIVHGPPPPPEDSTLAVPHASGGFQVWQGDHAAMTGYLSTGPHRWVQDPTAWLAVASTAGLKPATILDFCAGRGTKTRQLSSLHPEATIYATDVDLDRLRDLRRSFVGNPKVKVILSSDLGPLREKIDLLLLDVPCSNTGVLARRLEARYRYSDRSIDSLIDLQRAIAHQTSPLLSRTAGRISAAIVYSTCSIDDRENRRQAQWLAQHQGLKITADHLALPGGDGATYHDGGYWALIKAV